MGLKTIAPRELHKLADDGRTAVFDVNSRQSWLTAHVPGAKHADPMTYDANELPADKDSLVVFYCSNPLCRKAPNAAKRAISFGYRTVKVMSAGITGWMSAGLPTASS